MFVERLLPEAQARLAMIAENAPLIEAAKLLRAGTDLVVVCGVEGTLAGVITKTDVVKQISVCEGRSCVAPASTVMSREVVLCRPVEDLRDVWSRMKELGVKNVPIRDDAGRPVGVLTARDALQVLLGEVEDQDALLRDYVMGIGYR